MALSSEGKNWLPLYIQSIVNFIHFQLFFLPKNKHPNRNFAPSADKIFDALNQWGGKDVILKQM